MILRMLNPSIIPAHSNPEVAGVVVDDVVGVVVGVEVIGSTTLSISRTI